MCRIAGIELSMFTEKKEVHHTSEWCRPESGWNLLGAFSG
jgi:hypothetical protein